MTECTTSISENHSERSVSSPLLRIVDTLSRLALVLVISFLPLFQSDPVYSQNIIKDFLKDNQIVVDPNKGNLIIQPKVICSPPFIANANNTKCLCPNGMKKQGNTCVPFNIQIICQLPFKPNAQGTKCVCPVGMKKIGNTCAPNQIQILCTAPFTLNPVTNKCTCPIGLKKQGNKCVPIPKLIFCKAPFVANAKGTKCVCPAGLKKKGNKCIPKQVQIQCNFPFVPNWKGNKCVCQAGQIKLGNTCVPIPTQIQCPAPFVPNSNGNKCVCPVGLNYQNGTCVPPQAGPVCSFPFVYSSRQNTCVCAKGYKLNSAGNRCIRIKASTPSIPKSTVREIQTCLARLGYDAGPADGAIGARTRNAWGNFRIDQGLQGRPNSLSDDVTQDRLFQACAALNEPQPEPDPVNEDVETDLPETGSFTNFDSEIGYPPLQCVSADLKDTFQSILPEGEEIGICGQSCVPIPDGMTPGQIAATSSTVNWCRNCTTIGESSLICTAPADYLDEEDESAN